MLTPAVIITSNTSNSATVINRPENQPERQPISSITSIINISNILSQSKHNNG
jgi:hypothetical protein